MRLRPGRRDGPVRRRTRGHSGGSVGPQRRESAQWTCRRGRRGRDAEKALTAVAGRTSVPGALLGAEDRRARRVIRLVPGVGGSSALALGKAARGTEREVPGSCARGRRRRWRGRRYSVRVGEVGEEGGRGAWRGRGGGHDGGRVQIAQPTSPGAGVVWQAREGGTELWDDDGEPLGDAGGRRNLHPELAGGYLR